MGDVISDWLLWRCVIATRSKQDHSNHGRNVQKVQEFKQLENLILERLTISPKHKIKSSKLKTKLDFGTHAYIKKY